MVTRGDQRSQGGGRRRRALVATTVCCCSLLAAAAPAWGEADNFFPNTTADTTNPASSCEFGSGEPCSLRDAVTKAGNHGKDSVVALATGTTYNLTQHKALPAAGTIVTTAHKVIINGNGSVIDGTGNSNESIMNGGGTSSNSLELSDLTFTNSPNEAALLFFGTGNLSMESVTFTNNTSNNGGPAALFVGEAGTVKLRSVSFTSNHGDQGVFEAGADIEGVKSALTLEDVLFEHNQGESLVISQNEAPVTLEGVVVDNNSGSDRASLEVNAGTFGATLQDIRVEGNTSTISRGTVELFGNFAALDGITIANNVVGERAGGALLNLIGTATANNWTVSGNQALGAGKTTPVGGGIEVSGGTLRLNHATVAENSAQGNADDLHTTNTGSIVALNSIVDGSSAAGAVACAADGGAITSGGHNIDLGTSCGFGATGDLSATDPRIGPLSTPAFQNQLPVRPLLYASPAVNAADSVNCPAADAFGTLRPQGVACDIGAVEATLTNLAVTNTASATSLGQGGGQVSYTITVSNSSGVTPQSTQLTDVLPAGASFVSAASSAGSCSGGPHVLCALGPLHRGTLVTVTIVANLLAAGANTNMAHVESELPDSEMTNDNASAVTTIGGPAGTGGPAPVLAPVLSRLSVAPHAFRADPAHPSKAHKTPSSGATVSYLDSLAATTVLSIQRPSHGVLRGGKCINAPKHLTTSERRHRCTRYLTVGHLTHTDRAGRNSLHLSGRISGHALAPGAYRISAVATVKGAPRSAPAVVGFSIKRQ